MDYIVTGIDSLESIAASHDCTVGELMKLNRMSSRMVFPGQKILVPQPLTESVDSESRTTSMQEVGYQFAGVENAGYELFSVDGIRKGPGGAVPAQHQRLSILTKTRSAPLPVNNEVDSDCLQRFLKIKVKQITESDGTVSGTLLVTPNCLMFDPDVSHPLVKENGQDLYGMVANIEEIVSVSVYKDISALTRDKLDTREDISETNTQEITPNLMQGDTTTDSEFELQLVSAHPPKQDTVSRPSNIEGSERSQLEQKKNSGKFAMDVSNETCLSSINEESQNLNSPSDHHCIQRNDDKTCIGVAQVYIRQRSPSSRTSPSLCDEEEQSRSCPEIGPNRAQHSKFGSNFSSNVARRSFGKLGRTLSARARSIQGTVTQGTKQVAQGVVSHTKIAAGGFYLDSLQTGLETGVKAMGEAANVAACQAKAAADAVAAVPGRMVDMGTSLVSDSINGMQDIFKVDVEEHRTESQLKREQSLATLEDLKQRTQRARDDSIARNRQNMLNILGYY
ncbi:LysM domain protein [Dictyocaulus viviparus]|uniref:LysM domain protein n=1 Tax=Dictyocaulus viviparus TaxID=29172 RepID=A0A0D8XBL7_DICVI|nr:LysM domain protein [Dictyocaulus viviparus]